MAEKVNYLGNGRIEEGEWFALVVLAKARGFGYLRGRRQGDGSGRFQFVSGMTQEQLHGLLLELRIGGWTQLPTTRKRHFFRKRGCMFDNPSLCKKHELNFYTNLEHDDRDDDKCVVCLRRSRKLEIEKVLSEETL